MADHQMRMPSEAAVGEGQQQQQQEQQQQQHEGSGDNSNRPSFTNYWQGEKESERAGRVQFVTEMHPPSSTSGAMAPPPMPQPQKQQGSSESPTSADTAKQKAKLRRQQVRKAQIQHRTRKANYIKQLELDICEIRDMIAAAERDMSVYRRQNEEIKGALRARGLIMPSEMKEKGVTVGEVRISGDPDVDDGLSYEEVLQQPVEIQPQPQAHVPEPQQPLLPGQTDTQIFSEQQQQMLPPAPPLQHPAQPLDYDPYPPADLFGDANMGEITVTMRKDETLGTPCFQISASPSNDASFARPATPDQLSTEQEITAINLILAMEHICWNHFHPRQFPRHADPCKAASGHTMMASTMCMSSAPERVYRSVRRREVEAQHSWQALGAGSSLSLKSLLSLAKTLNPGDIELTPVQAWFELAARYGTAVLMEDRVIEALKREFCGVVDCIHFGAIIERDAFESVVARVMAEVGVSELEYEMDVDRDIRASSGAGMMIGTQQIAV